MGFFVVKKKNILITAAVVFVLCISFFLALYSETIMNVFSSSDSPKTNLTVVIDAGHGGIDVGAVGINKKALESDINLSISKILETKLKRAGIKVVQTRRTKDGLYTTFGKHYKREDMLARKKIIEEAEADAVISIHQNSFPLSSKRGAQIFYQEKRESGKLFANEVTVAMQKTIDTKVYQPGSGDFYILNCTNVPSILIEGGYLSNSEDERLLSDKDYQNKLAYSIFCGVMKYFGIVNY